MTIFIESTGELMSFDHKDQPRNERGHFQPGSISKNNKILDIYHRNMIASALKDHANRTGNGSASDQDKVFNKLREEAKQLHPDKNFPLSHNTEQARKLGAMSPVAHEVLVGAVKNNGFEPKHPHEHSAVEELTQRGMATKNWKGKVTATDKGKEHVEKHSSKADPVSNNWDNSNYRPGDLI